MTEKVEVEVRGLFSVPIVAEPVWIECDGEVPLTVQHGLRTEWGVVFRTSKLPCQAQGSNSASKNTKPHIPKGSKGGFGRRKGNED